MKLSTLGWTAIVLVSAGTVAGAIFIGANLPGAEYAPIVSLVAAVSNFLAVVWFTSTLLYQSRQLREQREQFAVNLDQMHRDAQRNSIVVAQSILKDAESLALSQNEQIASLSNLPSMYTNLAEMKVLLESNDPNEIIEAGIKWFKQEGPAMTLMRGIKSAAMIYQESTGKPIFRTTAEPEEFVYMNGPLLWNIPFFQNYQGTSDLLAGLMVQFQPGRTSARVAYMIALARTTTPNILRKDKLLEELKALNDNHFPIPKIAHGF